MYTILPLKDLKSLFDNSDVACNIVLTSNAGEGSSWVLNNMYFRTSHDFDASWTMFVTAAVSWSAADLCRRMVSTLVILSRNAFSCSLVSMPSSKTATSITISPTSQQDILHKLSSAKSNIVCSVNNVQDSSGNDSTICSIRPDRKNIIPEFVCLCCRPEIVGGIKQLEHQLELLLLPNTQG